MQCSIWPPNLGKSLNEMIEKSLSVVIFDNFVAWDGIKYSKLWTDQLSPLPNQKKKKMFPGTMKLMVAKWHFSELLSQ